MKTLLLLFILINFKMLHAQNIPDEQRLKFVNEFLTAVRVHDQKATIKKLDKSYINKQLKKNLKGNKQQFLDELFSGRDEKTKEYLTIPFDAIISIEVAEVVPNDETMTDYFFIVKTDKNEVICQLFLKHRKVGKKYKLGFEGSFG